MSEFEHPGWHLSTMSPTSNDSGKPDLIPRQAPWRRSQDNTLLLTREVIACVVRAEDEASLYQSICRVIVERGDYLLAAIFEIQPVEQRIKVLHAYGQATGYLDGVEIRIDDSPAGRGPTGQSVRSGRPVAVNDVQGDPNYGYWSERARQYAIQSSVSVPLKVRGEVRWLLTIYSRKQNAFEPVEVELLELLANDLAYGIDALLTRRERDQAAVRARLATQRLDLAARGAGIGIWEYDLDAKEPIWDAQTYRLFGHAPDSPLGPDEIVAVALGPPMHLRLRVHRNWCIRNQTLFEMELPIHLPDDSQRWLMTRARPEVDPQGVAKHLVGVIFDVTDQVQARNEQAARRLVEEASRAKSEFIARMSHELHTPLHVVLGFSALMRQDPGFTLAQLRNIDIIHHSGEHLLSLVNDILDLSRIEAGRMPMDSGATDLRSLVRDVMDMMRVRAEEKRLALVLDETPAAPHYLRVDQVKLRQVLINLLSNAIKFTQQGRVTLRLSGQHDGKDQRLHIEVQDSGVGLHTQDLDRIFEPFVQVGEFSTQGGSGLGLAITRQFVELMGGTISVQSTPGAGSTFRVELPAALAAASEVAASPSDTRLAERQTAALRQDTAPEILPPQSLTVLPPALRQALQEALISLDSHRIEAVISQVSPCDASLGRALAHLAGQYHYTPILVALAQQEKGNPV
jgi:signal transduction histidine kinase